MYGATPCPFTGSDQKELVFLPSHALHLRANDMFRKGCFSKVAENRTNGISRSVQ